MPRKDTAVVTHFHIAYPRTTRLVMPAKRWAYDTRSAAEQRVERIRAYSPGYDAAIVERKGSLLDCHCRN
jgi:hypothetical protein